MKHDELRAKLGIYESANDRVIVPGMYVVVRLDGRGFSRLTKERLPLARPFDVRFRDWMIETARHLCVESGFAIALAYVQSDEISLLLRTGEQLFGRRASKWISVLAGEASARFALLAGEVAAFDARLLELPRAELVVDYVRWRSDDAARNALNGHAYWLLRERGLDARAATRELERASVSQRHDLLHQAGTPFQELPPWQRRGVALWMRDEPHEGVDPRTGAPVATTRRALHLELELPIGAALDALVRERIADADS